MLVLSYHEFGWAHENPLPWEYRLLHDLIWRFGSPPSTALPPVPAAGHASAAGPLWEHPYFQGWYLDSAPVYGLAEEILSTYEMPLLELPDDDDPPGTCPSAFAGLVRACSDSRLARCFPVQDRAVYAWRLARSAEWLACAGDVATAALARGAAGSLPGEAIAGNAFALTLLQRSIYRAASLLTEGHRPLTVH